MNEEAFIEAILTEADDHVSRLAFADWLSERDDPRETLLRAQGELGPSLHLPVGLKLVPIPPGKFTMGSPESEPHRDPDEYGHEVEITRPFYLGATPVTVGEFRKFVRATRHETMAELTAGVGWNSETGQWERGAYRWREPGWKQRDDEPVVCLAWEDATAFCDWLRRLDGREYRLPTEAEWEYACRAWTTTPYYFGEELTAFQANYSHPENPAHAIHEGRGQTTAVGSYPANAFGLYDMHGNVWEWCQDWYDYSYYERSRQSRDPTGGTTGYGRVLRGGAWCVSAHDCRSALRRCGHPFFSRYHDGATGFRVAMTMPQLSRKKRKKQR